MSGRIGPRVWRISRFCQFLMINSLSRVSVGGPLQRQTFPALSYKGSSYSVTFDYVPTIFSINKLVLFIDITEYCSIVYVADK